MDFDKQHYNVKEVKRTPFYFGPENKRLIGWLHTPVNESLVKNTGVVICPPIGVEYMSTYRSLRYVADYFALSGIPAFRFDYNGTGDSSGQNEDADRVNHWLWSIEQAAEQLKKYTSCQSVGLFGLRIGAILAADVAQRLAVSFLVLWAAPDSGKKYLREVKMAQMTGLNEDAPDERFIEAGGAMYYPDTEKALNEIDLFKTKPNAQRILIVPRDDLSVKDKLLAHWISLGLNVEQKPLTGSADMLLSGYSALVPFESIAAIVDWVNTSESIHIQKYNNKKLVTDLTSSIDIEHYTYDASKQSTSNSSIKETMIRYGENDSCFGILTEPAQKASEDLPIIIITNSGITHRVGPSRLYVLMARQLSALGFRCFRIDMSGIGDSIASDSANENLEYIKTSSEEIKTAIQALSPNYKNNKYILMGLCSGAYFSFHAAIDIDEIDIVECILINPLTFYWDHESGTVPSTGENFTLWNWYRKAILQPSSWIKLFTGKIQISGFVEALWSRLQLILKLKAKHITQQALGVKKHRPEMDLDWDLLHLAENKTNIIFVLARSDPGYDILMTTAGTTVNKLLVKKELQIEFIEKADHTFSKYQPRCEVIETICQGLRKRYL